MTYLVIGEGDLTPMLRGCAARRGRARGKSWLRRGRLGDTKCLVGSWIVGGSLMRGPLQYLARTGGFHRFLDALDALDALQLPDADSKLHACSASSQLPDADSKLPGDNHALPQLPDADSKHPGDNHALLRRFGAALSRFAQIRGAMLRLGVSDMGTLADR